MGVLSGHIIDCMFDSTFIIASQKPRDSIRECSGKIPDMILKGCDEAFEKSTYRQYWIINKKIGNVYGLYKKEEYLKKLQELNIPSTIKLKE
ncbi:MAG: DUF3997 domain-containing protein [Flammeovirgaceae bacterium]